ncbi:MAG: tetratricopeptide repeat protein [Lentimicrobiaceae bacterium]|nr:tetratricopeptide repeat protein [Lentimicrobiaceae bacterium]
MKKIAFLLVVLFLSFSIGLFAQKSGKKKQSKKETTENQYRTKEEMYITAAFLDAVKERLNGNYTAAENLLLDVLAKNPNHDAAYYEYAKLYLQKNKISDAIRELKTAISLCDSNIWYKVLLAETYDQAGMYNLSEPLWAAVIKAQPQNWEYLYKYTISLIYQKKLKEAIGSYNLLEVQMGVSEEITYAKCEIWLRLNKVDNAVKELEKLAEENPNNPKYYLEIADMYIVSKMQEKAVPYLKKAKEINPNNPRIDVTLYNYYLEKKNDAEAFAYLKSAFASSELNIDEKIRMIMLDYYMFFRTNAKVKEEAYILAEQLTIAHADDPKAWSMYADFLVADNRYAEAKEAFEKVISLNDAKYLVWEQYLSVLMQLDLSEDAVNQSNRAIELFPTQPFPYLIKGISLFIQKDYSTAVDALDDGLQYVAEEKQKYQFYFYLAESYEKMQNYAKSDNYYEVLIEKQPQNATVHNNYSYSLAERGQRIELALALAKKANELEPNTAYYQDTYGWAFFKNNDYPNAKIWLEKALKNGGENDYDVVNHYSIVLETMGETQKAEEYRQKAEQLKQSDEKE